jgi:Fe-S-cluster containining protein
MAALLGVSECDFIRQHTELVRDRRDLVSKVKPDGVCIFIEANDCMVYPARPQQCMDYPVKWNNPGWENICGNRGPAPPGRLCAVANRIR